MPRHAMAAMAAAAAVVITLPGAKADKLARGMDLCTSYSRVCSDITSQVSTWERMIGVETFMKCGRIIDRIVQTPPDVQLDCRSHFDGQTSKPMLTMQSCQAGSYDTYLGHCKCAALDARYAYACSSLLG